MLSRGTMRHMDDARPCPSREPLFTRAFLTRADTDYELESFVIVGGRIECWTHQSQHPDPRGEEKLTKVATDEYSRHHARVTTLHSSLAVDGTDTANIFSPMCLVTGRGAHGERREYIENYKFEAG